MSEVNEKKMEKLEKKLTDTFIAETRTASKEKLQDIIVNLSKRIEAVESQKAGDVKLQAAKEMVKDLNGAYGDVLKDIKPQLSYAILTLQGKEE